jgi:hypothetical protein
MCSTPAECARSADFQGRNPAYQPNEHEIDVARQALERQIEDPTNGAVYFFDTSTGMAAPAYFRAKLSNLDQMDEKVKEVIQPEPVTFYFLSDEEWKAYYGTPTP